MNAEKETNKARRWGGRWRRAAALTICLGCVPFSAWAGESIVWNGAGNPGTTGTMQPDPSSLGVQALFPDGPSGNSVTVNADVPGLVYGGLDFHDAADAAVANNSAVVNGGSVHGGVYGGAAGSAFGSATATATGNSAIVNGGSVGFNVSGGYAYSYSGSATGTGNSAIVNGGQVDGNVDGGQTGTDYGAASATGNSAIANGGTVSGSVRGGVTFSNGTGTATTTGNSAVVNSGTVSDGVVGGSARSGSGSTTATGNSAVVNGGSVHGGVYGGYASSFSGSATATDNSAVVNGGSVDGGVRGGEADSYSGSATATGNSAVVNGGSVHGGVYGGSAGSAFGSATATATGNSAVVNGGSVHGGVYGGSAYSYSGSATATGNSVTLSGSPVFGANSDIWGGEAKVGIASGDAFSNNTLNVWNYTGSPVRDVRNFQYYHFVLPAAMRGGDTLFRAGTVTLGNGAGTDSTVSGVSILGGGAPLRAGDSVTLINGNFSGTIGNNNALIRGQKGVSLLYDFRLSQTATALAATVAGAPRLNPQTKALSEGRVAGLALVNQGADLIAGTGMDAARQAASPSGGAGFSPFSPFFAFQGGTARYDTGSHADLDGFSLLAGLAWNRETAGGRLLLGAFFESGWGDYDSRNAFNGFASVQGQGDTQYYGGGVLGRMEFPLGRAGRAAAARPSVLYVEASARAGWADTDFSSHDLRDGMGRNTSYASGAIYYGAHLGLGYVWNITDRSSLDVYTRYFWTRQDGDAVSVTDDPIRFESSDSHRWRAGARFSHALTTAGGLVVTPYLGAAWEHEFDGRAQATAYGLALDAPDLTGGTGIGELGVSFRPSAQSGLSVDLALRGHAGVRRGVSGGFQAKWSF